MKPGTQSFKTEKVYLAHSTKEHDHQLARIEFWVIKTFGMVVTCAYRKKRHKNDLHGTIPVRAKDIRSWCYDNPEEVTAAINNKWVYDPTRPKKKIAVYHDSGEGPHIHLQTHPRTRRRM